MEVWISFVVLIIDQLLCDQRGGASLWRHFRSSKIENIGREMINIDWNGHDNASTHSTVVDWTWVVSTTNFHRRTFIKHHCQTNPVTTNSMFSLQLRQWYGKRFDITNIQSKPDKHESLFVLISTVYLIKSRTTSKSGPKPITHIEFTFSFGKCRNVWQFFN